MLHYELWGGGGGRATAAKHNNATRPNATANNAATADAAANKAAAANTTTANAAAANATTAAVCTFTSDRQRARTVLVLKRQKIRRLLAATGNRIITKTINHKADILYSLTECNPPYYSPYPYSPRS